MPTCRITISAPIVGKRPPGIVWEDVSPTTYPVQSLSYSASWGVEPAQANIVYVSNDSPIPIGAACKCELGLYMFQGICEACVPLISSRGNTWQLTVKDYRKWLAWDKVYCTFNNIDDKLINGVRQRRYWHILPWNFATMRKTWNLSTAFAWNNDLQTGTPYQDGPLSGFQIMQFIMGGPGIETPWTFGYLDNAGNLHQNQYHPNMALPIYELDAMNGKEFGVVLSEICDRLGLLFTLMPTNEHPYNLVFAQKGVDGPDMVAPATSDNREAGIELSNNPTRIRVLGDRNLYQIHDINLVPDWNANWTQFYDFALFEQYIFNNRGAFGITWNSGADPEQIIVRQEIKSFALEMTVQQFDNASGGSGFWLDSRRYCGKARNNMPVALYIRNILFRIYKLPPTFFFNNTYGNRMDQYCAEIQDKLLSKVTHDPNTGLTQYDTTKSVDGNAYVIVQGYQIGKDMFATVRPERFNLDGWRKSQDIWQKIDVRIEDAGDPYSAAIVFEEPVIKCDNLVRLVDGYAVFNAQPTRQDGSPGFDIPFVRATLTFAGEKFSWFQTDFNSTPTNEPADTLMGTQTHDDVLNINGLNGEFIAVPGAGLYEMWYADGKSCRYKAIENANNVLKFQYLHARGGFKDPISDTSTPYQLHGKCDRLTLEHGPQGSTVTVGLTNERKRINYVPERDLDRTQQLNTLLPGQMEVIHERGFAKKIAMAVKSSKDSYKLLSEAFHGNFSDGASAKPVLVQPF